MGFFKNLMSRITRKIDSQTSRSAIATPLPSSDAIDKAMDDSARRLSNLAKNMQIPFTPLTEPFMLDAKEQWWSERELEGSGLSETDYAEEVWEIIVEKFGMTNGLHKSTEVKYQEEDYAGALSSWLKWVAMFTKGFSIAYVGKEDWLLLAKIYVGARCPDSGKKALAWAKAAENAEQAPGGRPKLVDEYMKADWQRQLKEVNAALKELDA